MTVLPFKIFYFSLLLDGPDDPAIKFKNYFFDYWTEDFSILADKIPFWPYLYYATVDAVAPELAVNILNRITNLNEVWINEPVEDIQRFLDFLNKFENFMYLHFSSCDQPQELFDRLAEQCAIQKLELLNPPNDLQFLYRFKSLLHLDLHCFIHIELIRKVLEELPFLLRFEFGFGERFSIDPWDDHSKQFEVRIPDQGIRVREKAKTIVNDLFSRLFLD